MQQSQQSSNHNTALLTFHPLCKIIATLYLYPTKSHGLLKSTGHTWGWTARADNNFINTGHTPPRFIIPPYDKKSIGVFPI